MGEAADESRETAEAGVVGIGGGAARRRAPPVGESMVTADGGVWEVGTEQGRAQAAAEPGGSEEDRVRVEARSRGAGIRHAIVDGVACGAVDRGRMRRAIPSRPCVADPAATVNHPILLPSLYPYF